MKHTVGIAIAALACVGVTATPAAASGSIQVSGVQLEAVPCDGPSTLTMTGDLTGCWYDDRSTVVAQPSSGVVVAKGDEHFVGCVAGRCGTLSFQYTFTGKFADPGVYLAEIWGHCQHLVVGSAGDLAGTSGFIRFTDNITDFTAPYTGHLLFR